jgi:hypothetical protein
MVIYEVARKNIASQEKGKGGKIICKGGIQTQGAMHNS